MEHVAVRILLWREQEPITGNPEAAKNVLINFNIDGYWESSQTVEEATRRAEDPVKLFSLGGFKLTKFVSNVVSIPQQLEANPTK